MIMGRVDSFKLLAAGRPGPSSSGGTPTPCCHCDTEAGGQAEAAAVGVTSHNYDPTSEADVTDSPSRTESARRDGLGRPSPSPTRDCQPEAAESPSLHGPKLRG